jgi:hypothetical protein
MKNIHILPTEKPSRLSILNSGKLNFGAEIMSSSNSKPQHIYITSDEEIKEGDAVIHDFGMGYELENPCDSDNLKSNTRSKIILTTDQDLITDGVQAISDEFLKWFVENPTCEFAEVVSELKAFDENGLCISFAMYDTDYTKMIYYVIPQKEAVLAKWGKMNKDLEDALESAFSSKKPNFTEVTINAFSKSMDLTLETVPETIEDAAERNCESITHPYCDREKSMFFKGAKWQAERSYSKEEVLQIYKDYEAYVIKTPITEVIEFSKWFGQIKKK